MFLDFYKFNYDLIPPQDRAKYIKRDKKAYESLLKKWLEDNVSLIIERKWEIADLFFLKENTDFSNLLREAEKLYEFGLYTSCVALVCIIAEDFTKFIALKTNNPDWVELKQYRRLQELLSHRLISQDSYDKLDKIRELRNSLLHFDDDFKAKTKEEIKGEALESLNILKSILSLHIGVKVSEMNPENFHDLVVKITDGLVGEEKVKNAEEIQYRLRNAVGQLFGLSLVFDPSQNTYMRESFFQITDIDFQSNEVDLIDLAMGCMPVCIDMDTTFQKIFKQLNKGDLIQATVFSEIDKLGQSSKFVFRAVKKLEN